MAVRNSATRLIPGNPLGSVLRNIDRKARSTTRRAAATPAPAPAPDPTPPPVTPGVFAVGHLTTTLPSGQVTWTLRPRPPAGSVLYGQGTAFGPTAGTVTVFDKGPDYITFRTWDASGAAAGFAFEAVAFIGHAVEST